MGCDNDQLLQIDHIKPLAQGGPTTLENTWRICRPHHRLKTYLGWTVDGPPGNRRLIPPDHPNPHRPDPP